MDHRYEAHCLAGGRFYDVLQAHDTPSDDFSRSLPEVGPDWRTHVRGVWRSLAPVHITLPAQGWKIHVSATMDNAERVLAVVFDYCLAVGTAFKHLRTKSILLASNSKYALRSASGKLMTIYPRDDAELARVLTDLSAALEGEPGPYILSDLRYRTGPLYLRYGGFLPRWVEHNGVRVPAIETPDGTLVPDVRKPVFHLPDWVEPPSFLRPCLAARATGSPDDFPYRITESLHHSNAGGVYLATRRSDGTKVVLKEARPHCGLDREQVDAVTRLHREHETLTRLAGITGVPAVHDRFSVWEHEYLAMQHMPGRPLSRWLATTYPLVRHATDQQVTDYTARALALLGRIEALVAEVHERGVVFADLHPHNVLVDEDDSVSLVDFELAFPIDRPARPALGAQGFRAPADRRGVDVDRYALAALRLWAFLPLTSVLELERGKLHQYLDFIEQRFDLPGGYCDRIRREMGGTGHDVAVTEWDQPAPDWHLVRKSITEAILASATPDRADRLFPGDVEQFVSGGTSFGYGAAGVLYALDTSGAGRFPDHEQWLVDAVRRTPPTRPGFYDGAHGIAHVLANFGHHDLAAEVVARCEPASDHSLAGGAAGVALNLLHLADLLGERDFLAEAERIGDRLAAALPTAAPPGSKGTAGLFHGWSGPGLLFVRLFERTDDRRWLDLADQAVARDLRECVSKEDGSLQVRDGRRTLPYLSVGGAGIALVLNELAAHAPQSGLLTDLLRGCYGEFVIHPGLALGRAGQLATLALVNRRLRDPELDRAISCHLANLRWHALPHGGGIAFPGHQLLRLSTDLGTGSAGVLLAVTAALDDNRPVLPFL
ncbi:serine/threonine protein kinase [Lentzea guizhouensis]|uniref:non-specific serine/threonine protein kinase n=1 Tax=Lentzea guizhouensis TaxID=1586287 RepID=A0A1B2HSZ1_9PSEU|nr:class III lanthionine synthetase LanKC [Lentzea guizhouensis]ANZ40856.1 serine/threonine protein kinase [Lentzea guizhouensis]